MWSGECEVWSGECEVWSVKCGLKCKCAHCGDCGVLECGVKSVECGCEHKL